MSGERLTIYRPRPQFYISVLSTPSVASLTSGPSVAQGSAPLMRHKMTFSHFSKDLIRHPVSGGQFAGAVLSIVTDSTPETGVVPRRGEGVDSFPF